MLIVKVWGSVFAPKNSTVFDLEYLKELKQKLDKIYDWKIALLHGTGNLWHGFVKKYWITKETWQQFVDFRDNWFQKIENIFTGYTRIPWVKILTLWKDSIEWVWNIISWGDAWEDSYEIVGSDNLFAKLIEWEKGGPHIILTDVDGVFDHTGEIIPIVKLSEIDTITFWEKEWDVTNSMKGKLLALQDFVHPESKWVWICNGHDLENFETIIKTGKGKWTLIQR